MHILKSRIPNPLSSVLSQLLMIRSKPGFLDRLVNRLQDFRDQAERSKRRVSEAHLRINEAMAEQERQAAILLKHRANCKRLVTLVGRLCTITSSILHFNHSCTKCCFGTISLSAHLVLDRLVAQKLQSRGCSSVNDAFFIKAHRLASQ